MAQVGPAYTYAARVASVHDGDTITADIDLGLQVRVLVVLRLAGCNARELAEPGGPEAQANLAWLLGSADRLQLTPMSDADAEEFAARWKQATTGAERSLLLDQPVRALSAGPTCTVRTVKPDKYGGRWLAQVWLPDGTDLVEHLIADGWAARWDGRGAKPAPPWPRPAN